MVLDWLILRALWRDLHRQLKRPGKLLIVAGGLTLIVVPMWYGMFASMEWLLGVLKRWGLEWMSGALAVLMTGSFVILILWITGRGIYHHIRDRRTFNRIAVTSRMPRQDIAAALDSLLTNHWRLAFVRQLAQQKSMATGNWPADFRLSVAGRVRPRGGLSESRLTTFRRIDRRPAVVFEGRAQARGVRIAEIEAEERAAIPFGRVAEGKRRGCGIRENPNPGSAASSRWSPLPGAGPGPGPL